MHSCSLKNKNPACGFGSWVDTAGWTLLNIVFICLPREEVKCCKISIPLTCDKRDATSSVFWVFYVHAQCVRPKPTAAEFEDCVHDVCVKKCTNIKIKGNSFWWPVSLCLAELENNLQNSHDKWFCCTDLSVFIAYFEDSPKWLAVHDLLGILKVIFYLTGSEICFRRECKYW